MSNTVGNLESQAHRAITPYRLNQGASAEPDSGSLMRIMKTTPEGCFKLGEDGVLRSFGPSPERVVLDAVGLNPTQIKGMLDRQPWSQETEDSFRGVDGRKVVGHEALYEPPDQYRPPKYTAKELEEAKARVREINRKKMEEYEKEKQEGVDVDAKYACGRKQADYDLTPCPQKADGSNDDQ